jgi:SSS family solute:Na+ symporter
MIVAFSIVAAFVFTSGVRGVAWVSVIKDSLLLFAAVFIGIAVPYIYFGGIGKMFAALIHARPTHLVMPGATKNLGHTWYISTVLLTSCGFYMWPQAFGSSFTAKSSETLRRNAVIMPLYGVTMPLMIFVGLCALLVLPKLPNGDLSLLTIVRKTFPDWFLGLIGGAGALTAMVPAAIQILTASTLFAKNLWRPIFAPNMSDQRVAILARIMVLAITAVAVISAVYSSATIVSLLLLGYAGVTQFFPGVVLGLFLRRISGKAVFSGIIAGISALTFLMLTRRDPWMGWNAGFVGLCLNLVVVATVTLAQPGRTREDTNVLATKASSV